MKKWVKIHRSLRIFTQSDFSGYEIDLFITRKPNLDIPAHIRSK